LRQKYRTKNSDSEQEKKPLSQEVVDDRMDEQIAEDDKYKPVTRRSLSEKYGQAPFPRSGSYSEDWGIDPNEYKVGDDYAWAIIKKLGQQGLLKNEDKTGDFISAVYAMALKEWEDLTGFRDKPPRSWNQTNPPKGYKAGQLLGQERDEVAEGSCQFILSQQDDVIGTDYNAGQITKAALQAGEKLFAKHNSGFLMGEIGRIDHFKFSSLQELDPEEGGSAFVDDFEYLFYPSTGRGKDVSGELWRDAKRSWVDVDGNIYAAWAEGVITIVTVDVPLNK